jgi:hypothetical protein
MRYDFARIPPPKTVSHIIDSAVPSLDHGHTNRSAVTAVRPDGSVIRHAILVRPEDPHTIPMRPEEPHVRGRSGHVALRSTPPRPR